METTPNVAKIDLATEKVSVLLRRYSLPSIVSMLIISLYNITDRIFIGQGVGAMAISGLALTFPLMTVFQAFGTLVGVGASSRISIVLGLKDVEWAEKILGNSLLLSLIISSVLIIIFLIFLKPFLVLLGGSEQTIPYAYDYLIIVLPGCIFSNITFCFSALIRATGYPKKSMMVAIIGVTINAILNPIFIFGFKMGIQGSAISTCIAMVVSSYFALRHFFNKSSLVRFRAHSFKLKRKIFRNITAIGMSPFLMNMTAASVSLFLNRSLLKYGGDLAIGAIGIIGSFTIASVMILLGICQGMQPIVGYNYGAKKLKRMKDTLILAIKAGTIFMVVFAGIAIFIPHGMVMLFTSDEKLIEISAQALRIVLYSYPLVAFQIISSNFYQSIGRPKLTIMISLLRQLIFLVPLIYIFGHWWGLKGIWLANPIADTLSFLVSLGVFLYQVKVFYPRKRIRFATPNEVSS